MAEFQCPYASFGTRRCPPSICDCHVDTHPDDPFGVHPEVFAVEGVTYLPLTQGKSTMIDPADAPAVWAHKWFAHRIRNRWYAGRNVQREDGTWALLHLHKFLTGYEMTDHINGDGLDNRRVNLRPATGHTNQQNRGPNRNNKSGFKGVSRRGARWQAHITAQGKHHALGVFDTPEDAARAYDAAAARLHGEFAYLNFPDDPFGLHPEAFTVTGTQEVEP